jgi:hypothetical protein
MARDFLLAVMSAPGPLQAPRPPATAGYWGPPVARVTPLAADELPQPDAGQQLAPLVSGIEASSSMPVATIGVSD